MGAVENTASLSSGTPASAVPPPGEAHGKPRGEPSSHQLSALLVWAVVFCDIGTSIYYVPGILYAQVGALTPLFIAATQARLEALADMYVFGLLGAFVMSSAGLDIIRWRLQRRGVGGEYY